MHFDIFVVRSTHSLSLCYFLKFHRFSSANDLICFVEEKLNFTGKKDIYNINQLKVKKYVWACVCMYAFAISATPFNLSLPNFGIKHSLYMWLSKNSFLKFLKKMFFAELLPFFYISLRFLCNFEEQLRKNQWR